MNLFRFTLGFQICRHSRPRWHTWTVIQYLRFQLFREKLYRPLRMLCRCLPWMIDSSVNDSSSRRLLFFGENLADGSDLFRREVRHANFEGTAVMSTLIFFPPRPFLISLSRKCSEQTFVISVSLNFVPTSLRIFCSHWARRFGSFGKLKKLTLFLLASTVPLWLQRGTQQLIFELELIPNEISSQETVALKKSRLDDRWF